MWAKKENNKNKGGMLLGIGWEKWLIGGGGWWGFDGGGTVPMEGIRTLSRAVPLTHRKG
jgi:hypothetical protein